MSDKATYQHSPQHYAKLYNVTGRTIYRWIDELPLDDQEAILLAKGKPAANHETAPHRAASGPETSQKPAAGALGLSASIARLSMNDDGYLGFTVIMEEDKLGFAGHGDYRSAKAEY